MADLITRLLLDTQKFDSNLGKSTKQVRGFQKRMQSISDRSTVAIGAMTKFAGAIGLVTGATEILQKGLNSNAKLQDKYNTLLGTSSTVVDQFFSSIYSGDWSVFNKGIMKAIENAKNFTRQYTNVMRMLNVNSARYERIEAEKNRLESIIEDENKSLKERKAAQVAMDTLLIKGIADIRHDVTNVESYLIGRLKEIGIEGDIDSAQKLMEDLYNPFSNKRKRAEEYRKIRDTKEQVINPNAFIYSGNDWSKIHGEASRKYYQNYTESDRKMLDAQLRLIDSLTEQEFAKMQQLFEGRSDLLDKSGTWQKDRVGGFDTVKDAANELKNQTKKAVADGVVDGKEKAEKEIKLSPLDIPIRGLTASDMEHAYIGPAGKDIASGKNKPLAISSDDIKTNIDYAESLNTIATVIGSVTNLASEGAAAWLAYGANIVTSISAALPALAEVIPALQALTMAQSAASASVVPVIGWINAIAAIGAVGAAFASLPKFADGGFISSPYTTGDRNVIRVNGGEMILNPRQQGHLFSMLDGGNVRKALDNFKIDMRLRGEDIVASIDTHERRTQKYR